MDRSGRLTPGHALPGACGWPLHPVGPVIKGRDWIGKIPGKYRIPSTTASFWEGADTRSVHLETLAFQTERYDMQSRSRGKGPLRVVQVLA